MKICEMHICNLFKLSSGDVAIVGNLSPNIDYYIPDNSKADLYVCGKKVCTIDIIGEDHFSGVNESIRKDKRSVRTNCKDVCDVIQKNNDARLVFYK